MAASKKATVDPRVRVMTPLSQPPAPTASQLRNAAGVSTRMTKLKRVLGPRAPRK